MLILILLFNRHGEVPIMARGSADFVIPIILLCLLALILMPFDLFFLSTQVEYMPLVEKTHRQVTLKRGSDSEIKDNYQLCVLLDAYKYCKPTTSEDYSRVLEGQAVRVQFTRSRIFRDIRVESIQLV